MLLGIAAGISASPVILPPDPFDANVLSHVRFEKNFDDEKGLIWYQGGSAGINKTSPLSGKGSGAFDGSGDYIWTPGDSSMNLGTGDFTIELLMQTTQTGEKTLVDYYSSGKRTWQLNILGGKLVLYVASPIYDYPLISVKSVNDGLPHSVCAERKDGILRFYIDGVLDGEAPLPYNFDFTTSKLALGAQVASRNTGYDFSGLLDNFRFTKGVARYTQDVVEPEPEPDPYWGNVASLHHFEGDVISDETGRVWTPSGTPQLRTDRKLFGEKAGHFDGYSVLSSAPSTDWAFRTGDFTVEFWINVDQPGYYMSPVGNWSGSKGWCFHIMPDNTAVFYINTSYVMTSVSAITPNVSHRIAITRSAGVVRLFLNGNKIDEKVINSDIDDTTGIVIGGDRTAGNNFRGYIDELRITKGVARYTGNYTLSESRFYSGTKFKKSFVMNGNQYFSQPLEGTINGPATMFIDFIPYALPPTSGSFDNLVTLIRHSSILNAAPFLNMSPSNITYNGIGMIRNAEPVQLYSIYPRGDLKVGERYRVFFVIPSGATSSVLGVIKSFINGSLKLSTADYAFPRPNIIGGTHVAGRAGLDGELVAFGICGSSLSDSTVAEIASNPAYDFTTLPNLVDLWLGGDYSAGTIPNKVSGRPALTLVNK